MFAIVGWIVKHQLVPMLSTAPVSWVYLITDRWTRFWDHAYGDAADDDDDHAHADAQKSAPNMLIYKVI